MDDPTAIARIQQDDPTGLETLVARYQRKAIATAFLIVHDPQLAEEVAQEAFVRVAEKIHLFDDRRSFAPWFFKIVINEAVRVARSQSRLTSLEEEPDDPVQFLAQALVDPHPQPETLLERKQSRQDVLAALKRLSPEQRAVVVMRYFLEMSETDMAARLERPPSTIKWWLRSARARLNGLLRASHSFDDHG